MKGKRTIGLELILMLTASCGAIFAQLPGGMNETTSTRLGGNNYVVGTLFSPGGVPMNRRIRVKLVSPTLGEVITTTDDRGQFVFSGVGAGSYSVVVDREENFEYASQSVEITEARNRIPQTYTVSIRLMERQRGSKKPAVVSTETLGAPKSASENYSKALDFAKLGDTKNAIERLKAAIAEFPGYFEARNELTVQYMRQGDLSKAHEEILAALKIQPKAYAALMNHGIILFRQNRFDEAENLLRDIAKNDEQQPLPRFYLGRTLIKKNRADEAIGHFNAAIELGGEQMKEAHRMLASIYIDKDDRPKAARELESYLRLAPDAADAAQLKEALAQIRAAIGKP